MVIDNRVSLPVVGKVLSLQALAAAIRHWWRLQELREQVRRERDLLAKLPEHLLRDIGISKGDAMAESQRQFNDIPSVRL